MGCCSIILDGCVVVNFHKSINKLEKDTISFNSLPVEVKEFFYDIKNIPTTESWNFSMTRLFTFNTTYEYEFKTIDAVKDLWISHYLLIDKTNNIIYRINYNIPRPVIVYNREIFIPTEYNVFSMLKNKSEEEIEKMNLTFDRYLLDSDRKYRRIWKKQSRANNAIKSQKIE